MRIEFWFDPICPFCWATSRWINRVAPERDLDVEWRPISLFFKNGLQPGDHYHDEASRTRNLLRVVEAVRAGGHADRIGDLYTEFGRHIHHRHELDFDVAKVLVQVGLDASFADALDDDQFDQAIKDGMAEGLALTGDDVGTPLIAIDGRNGRRGFFGPVITEVPDGDDALELWDGFVKMAGTNGFFELKRTRDAMPTLVDESVLDEQVQR